MRLLVAFVLLIPVGLAQHGGGFGRGASGGRAFAGRGRVLRSHPGFSNRRGGRFGRFGNRGFGAYLSIFGDFGFWGDYPDWAGYG